MTWTQAFYVPELGFELILYSMHSYDKDKCMAVLIVIYACYAINLKQYILCAQIILFFHYFFTITLPLNWTQNVFLHIFHHCHSMSF